MFPDASSTSYWSSAPMRILTSLLCLSALASAQDPVEGKKLFEIKCGVCHTTRFAETTIALAQGRENGYVC